MNALTTTMDKKRYVLVLLVFMLLSMEGRAQSFISLTYNVIQLTLTAPTVAGGHTEQVTNTNYQLQFGNAVRRTQNKISVAVTSGSVPSGLNLYLTADLPYWGNYFTTMGKQLLTSTSVDVITNIVEGYYLQSPLTWTLAVSNFGQLYAATSSMTITFTMTAQ
jgi:hypothetical protein